MLEMFITVIHVSTALFMILVVLVQGGNSGGVGAAFGGGGEFYRSKRGIDKFLFYGTFALTFLFIGCAIATLFVK